MSAVRYSRSPHAWLGLCRCAAGACADRWLLRCKRAVSMTLHGSLGVPRETSVGHSASGYTFGLPALAVHECPNENICQDCCQVPKLNKHSSRALAHTERVCACLVHVSLARTVPVTLAVKSVDLAGAPTRATQGTSSDAPDWIVAASP